jgi:alpha-methylacyl-CoA racemase
VPGPLDTLKVIEIAGLGPAPFAAMMLSDMGAEVLRIDRVDMVGSVDRSEARKAVIHRGRRSAAINLRHPDGAKTVRRLAQSADVLIEGFRPGVMERLGIGPQECLGDNPGLIYGRVTGWGREGPLAAAAGHDINYIALSGALEPIGRFGDRPVPPLNLVGDFGGGGMFLAFGILAALFERARTGRGQVVDAAMVDGAASLTTMLHGLRAQGVWLDTRGVNLVDGGAHFYDTYECADGKYICVGAIEPQFYSQLVKRLQLEDELVLAEQTDRARWPDDRQTLARVFEARTRDEWCSLLEGTDACFAPVLSLEEAPFHPHNQMRETFQTVEGVVQPAPAPRYSRTPGRISRPPSAPGEHTDEALADWGIPREDIDSLRAAEVIA